MATFTITTNVNIDSLTSKAGDDTYNINGTGASLTIDQDSRYGLNNNTSAVMGALTPSATLGGSVQLDGSQIWLIPYNSGSGNVPADGTTISKGSASGKLIGVYDTLAVAPTAAGAAMPADGFIKVKQWNGTLYGTGALTGLTATATSGERVGWIEVNGVNTRIWLFSRPNQTYGDGYLIKGGWYEIGTTDGNRATTYQIPTNGVASFHGGVLVDKAAATSISAASWSGGVMTVTSTAHGLSDGDRVFISGVTPLAYNSDFTQLQAITVTGANTFTMPRTTNPGTYTSGGTVAATEWYPTTNSLNTLVGTEALRGKHCWLDSTTGVLRFGNDNITSTGGFIPATGLKVRIPNVFTSESSAAAKTVNTTPSTTMGSRFRFYGGQSGRIYVSHMTGTWGASSWITGRNHVVNDSAFLSNMVITSAQAPFYLTNMCIGQQTTSTATNALSIATNTEGGYLTDCYISIGDMGTKDVLNISGSYDLELSRCKLLHTGDNTNSGANTIQISILEGLTVSDCVIGGYVNGSQASDVTFTNNKFYTSAYGRTPVLNPGWMFDVSNLSDNWLIDGIDFDGIAGQFPRSGLITGASACSNLIIRNLGTYASPYDGGFGYKTGKAWTRVTTTATVTEVAHGYRTGDQLVLQFTSDGTAIVYGVKIITVTGADTFTFVCANAAGTSGTIDYYVAGINTLINTSSAYNWKIQNIHVRGTYSASAWATNTSNKGLVMENVSVDPRHYNARPTLDSQNMRLTSNYQTNYPTRSASTSVVGTHFWDYYQHEPSVPGAATRVVSATWTRVTTVITVTSTAHGLLPLQRIYTINSSNQAAIPNGYRGLTMVPTDANTFTFTGVNSGTTSGTLDYAVEGDGVLAIWMNEESGETVGQATLTAGTPTFTGAGTLVAGTIGDTVVWETPEFIIGFNSFATIPAIPYTPAAVSDYDFYYDIDTGSGFSGSYSNLSYNRAGGGGTSGTTNVTMTSTTGVVAGDYIFGIGIADGATVVSITNPTTIVVSANNTTTVSGTLNFNHIPAVGTLPSTGFKLKVKLVTNNTNTGQLTAFIIPMLSTGTTRARLYSQAATVPISIQILDSSTLDPVQNARVYIRADAGGDLTDGDEIATGLTDVDGYFTDDFEYTSDQPISGWARKSTSSPLYKQAPIGGTITNEGFTTVSFLVADE